MAFKGRHIKYRRPDSIYFEPEYSAWRNMRGRCKRSKYYAGRGIKVCERWNSYSAFLADMGRRPSPLHSIDRIDNNGDYEPSNCRWATKEAQQNNTRMTTAVNFNGTTMSVSQLKRATGSKLQPSTIIGRIRSGIAPEDAVTMPRYGMRQQRRSST